MLESATALRLTMHGAGHRRQIGEALGKERHELKAE
jgi:hypothetical protein